MEILYLTSHLSKIQGGPLLMLNFARSVKAVEPSSNIMLISLEENRYGYLPQIPYNDVKVFFFQARTSRKRSYILVKSLFGLPSSFFATLSSYKTFNFDFEKIKQFLEDAGRKYDIIHGVSWRAPYTIIQSLFLKGSLSRSKYVCHVLYHPTVYVDPSSIFTKLFGRKLSVPLRALYEHYTMKSVLSKVNAITTSTPYEYEFLRKIGFDNVYFVGEGVDLDFIYNNIHIISERSNKIRKELSEKRVLLYIGGKSYIKGYYHFLEAARTLIKYQKDVIFISVGTINPNDPYASVIQYLETKLLNEGYLKTYKNISEIEKLALIMLSDVIVLPSARETIPLVFLEAWAFKKPVIGSYLPTISSITLTGEKSAHLIPFGDVRKLIEAMHILIEDKKYAYSLGNAGYHKVIEIYNLKSIGKRLRKIYKKIL